MTTSAHASPVMARRSWYVEASAADRLAALVEDLHHLTRRPKHEVLAAAIEVALEHQDGIRDRLAGAPTRTEPAR